MKRSVKTVFWIYTLLFFLIIGNLIKISIFDRSKIINNPYNPRVSNMSQTIKRGSILDAKERPIAETVRVDDANDELGRGYHYERAYRYARAFSHITGYTGQGKTGVESEYNYILETVSNELLQNISSIISDDDIKGNDVVLTIDADLQLYAAQQLGASMNIFNLVALRSNPMICIISGFRITHQIGSGSKPIMINTMTATEGIITSIA